MTTIKERQPFIQKNPLSVAVNALLTLTKQINRWVVHYVEIFI